MWLLSVVGRGVLVRSSIDEQSVRSSAPPSNSKPTPNRGRSGRLLLSGLAGLAAVILLFIGSFSDPITAMGNLYSAFADAQAPVSQTTATPVPVLAAVTPLDRDEEGTVGHHHAGEADLAAPIAPVWALKAALAAVTPPAHPERPSKHGWQRGRQGPVSAFVAQSHRGTWLFPPNPN
jgi:hypothetical protein